jgi:hypothetical protein
MIRPQSLQLQREYLAIYPAAGLYAKADLSFHQVDNINAPGMQVFRNNMHLILIIAAYSITNSV